MNDRIKKVFLQSIAVKTLILGNELLLDEIEKSVDIVVDAFRNNHRVLFCGNGGSAADAQHLAAEFSGRFYYDRPPLDAEALHVNTSYLTAVGNDYSFDEIYARLVKAKGSKGDVLVALSTSGNSQNILNAIETAHENGLFTIGLTGETGGKMASLCDIIIKVPSKDTPRIQEAHITIGHIICELVEAAIYPR
ncbi:MAG: D-sedoheptulose 7-phosphate isomerase [Lentimicrobium sp.]|jgi:D-sedoheptulose 7-phosphate isomerase|nr:D-sedoheptulose 7-phosphate isomerase [Lentimicrobium sp.]